MKFYIQITIYFYQVRCFSKFTNTHLYTYKKKLNKKILKSTYHIAPHGSPCDFTCTSKDFFTQIIMCESMHFNVPKTFHMIFT